MASGDTYEVAVDYSVKGEHCVNVFHIIEDVACMETIPSKEIGAAVIADWIPDWAAILSNLCTFNCVYVRRVAPAPGIAFTSLLATPGGEGGEPIPTTSAAVVSLYTAVAGPSKRGRKYFAGLPESAQNGGLLETAAVTQIEAVMATIMATLTGANSGEWLLGVWSPKLETPAQVVASIVRTNLGSMRTRRQRPGTP